MKPNHLIKILASAFLGLTAFTSCNDYLDVVPDDGNPTIDNAFHLRSTAIRFLGTCYSFIPTTGNSANDPGLLGGDEFCDLWGRVVTNTAARVPSTMTNMARGYMTSSKIYSNDWNDMYIGIRDCDILMENIKDVPDMEETEKTQWIAEAKFLKALFHFELIRKWGAIPVARKSQNIDAGISNVRVYRDPIDTCFNYVLQLLDEAEPNLPKSVDLSQYGRITQPICAAFRARVVCYAASPLFNGNEDMAKLKDNRGVQLFPQKTEEQKRERWEYAMTACKHAIDVCHEANIKLYHGDDISYRMNDTLKTDLTLRGAMTARWNSEIIWGNTQTPKSMLTSWQRMTPPNIQYSVSDADRSKFVGQLSCYSIVGVPLKIAEEFYTQHGVPIRFDKERVGQNELDIVLTDSSDKFRLQPNYPNIRLNLGREPRFYAFLGFDGCKWLGGLTNYNDLKSNDVYDVECRLGQNQGKTGHSTETGPVTGYFPKKMYAYQNRLAGNGADMAVYYYPWPEMRLSDLYLLYAESINEAEGPNGAHSAEMFAYVDSVRTRAQIPDVKTAWDKYSTNPGYYNTQTGMRNIIHAERLIELSFESQRFWDLRRWKEAAEEYAKGMYGFTVTASLPEEYYRKVQIFNQPFLQKDYFWPISRSDMEHNVNLVQNPGW